MTTPSPELMIVLPVYNEQAPVRKVISEWFAEIENWTEDFVFLVIDDGSSDGTPAILERLQAQLGPRLEVHRHDNRGHGQSCLEGYRRALERDIPWVFQIDSDGQCDPQYFFRFWRLRKSADVIYGERRQRDDGWRRVVASLVLKVVLLVFGGVWCVDANVPYRLMRTSILRSRIEAIPRDFFLSNVGLAVLLRRDPTVRHASVPIRFRERYGGEPSVAIAQFRSKAFELIGQLRRLRATEIAGSAKSAGAT
ncbi:MAG: glycosyltransferase family 2 protein [Chthoniobacter sp.]|nr:glycosyltransferase family 2 protein [Chthoniobacter sp.]